MRRDYSWFTKRAAQIWQATPGRSFLLVVPYGCNEAAAATAIAEWVTDHFRPPGHSKNSRPIVVRITPDGVTSSFHFVRKLCQEVTKLVPEDFGIEANDYPSEILEILIDAAHDRGVTQF